MELDKIITGDSAVVLQSLPPDCIDLTVTSPPYDNLRTYNGFVFDFETIARELFRVTKARGVVVWVVNDAVIDGSESGTSFRQALYFMQCGFNLHDTMIYWKNAFAFPEVNRYAGCFEYMFVFSKGSPKTANIQRVATNQENRVKGKVSSYRQATGETLKKMVNGKNDRPMENIWIYEVGYSKSTTDKEAFDHPAMYPERLASDHILSWSNEGDIVLDCFTGSGTTLKMAKMLNRHYLGIEISPEYVTLAEKRLLATPVPLFGQGRGLTPREPDKRDSSPSQAFTQPEFLSDLEGLS